MFLFAVYQHMGFVSKEKLQGSFPLPQSSQQDSSHAMDQISPVHCRIGWQHPWSLPSRSLFPAHSQVVSIKQ